VRLASDLAGDALWAALDALAARTGRSVEAYAHVHAVLTHVHAQAGGREHVSPAVLIEAFRDYTLATLGGQALVALDLWGIACTLDVGVLAMGLVEAKLAEAHASDRRSDFARGFDFESAFPLAPPEQVGLVPPESSRRATGGPEDAQWDALLEGRLIDGFLFLLEVVRHAQARGHVLGHVSSAQFLDAFRDLAQARFGTSALDVLARWGLRRTEDVGEMVFALVEGGGMSSTPDDDPSDFDGGFDFETAFPRAGPPST
jgi:uncharacterized repeat protein (TIGR04138 family)